MFDNNQIKKVQKFKSLLAEYNQQVNIYSKRSYDDLDGHIQDSFHLAQFIQPSERHVDLGSGAGLPGVIMAIASSSLIICVESKEKKRAFLKHVKYALDLKNLSIFEGDVQRFAKCYSGLQITSFSAKAFAKPPKLLMYLSKFKSNQFQKNAVCWVPISERQASFLSAYDDVVSIKNKAIFYYFKIRMGAFQSYKADLKRQYSL